MHFQLFIITFLIQIISVILSTDNANETGSNRTLSRKKRYLTFPEGSSFQLVYCLTLPTYGMGSIFTIGLTAALAWELPHEPSDYNFKKTKSTDAEKRVDKTNANIKPVNQQPLNIWGSYKQTQPQYHQLYATNGSFVSTNHKQSTKYQTLGVENDWGYLPAYRDENLYRKYGGVHRRTRRELFTKIEKFFEAQNKDGKACLLKALCEVNQTRDSKKGTFVEEILRAIFTWIPSETIEQEHKMFDSAASHKGNCTDMFPSCRQSVWNPFF